MQENYKSLSSLQDEYLNYLPSKVEKKICLKSLMIIEKSVWLNYLFCNSLKSNEFVHNANKF